jgi:hypothetical protein
MDGEPQLKQALDIICEADRATDPEKNRPNMSRRKVSKLGTFLRCQNDDRRLRDAAHASLNHDSFISDSWY